MPVVEGTLVRSLDPVPVLRGSHSVGYILSSRISSPLLLVFIITPINCASYPLNNRQGVQELQVKKVETDSVAQDD